MGHQFNSNTCWRCVHSTESVKLYKYLLRLKVTDISGEESISKALSIQSCSQNYNCIYQQLLCLQWKNLSDNDTV